MDETRTATLSLHAHEQGVPLGLVVAWHPDPRFVGVRRIVHGGERLILGRNSDDFAPGVFREHRVSRQHAQLGRLGEALSVQDLRSRNGTFVNGERVPSAPLLPNDVLAIGNVLLLVRRFPKREAEPRSSRLVGSSEALAEAVALVDKVAPRHELPVLVLGESGTGKELVAREVHERSGRPGEFVAVNCAGVADTLLQSELFGHVRGAFSGADRPRRGLVEQARGGTLFLDELGDASLTLQASLLRLLQEKEVRPVGSDRPVRVDARFVAATNRELADEVRAGRFREDLYARLNRMVVRLPPLKERREDILPLAAHFASAFTGRPVRLGFALSQALLLHDWPGNARSLQAIVERLALEFEGEDELPAPAWLEQELASHARYEAEPLTPQPTEEVQRERVALEDVDLREALLRHRGNVSSLAQELGVGRNTLYRWIKQKGVDLDALRREL